MPDNTSLITQRVIAHLVDAKIKVHRILELSPNVVGVQYDFMDEYDFVLYFGVNVGEVERCTKHLWVSKDIYYGRIFRKTQEGSFPIFQGADESWLSAASARLAAKGIKFDWHSTPKEVEIPKLIKASNLI